jgi:hypothetical protein
MTISLKEKIQALNSNGGVPFMENRTKGDKLPTQSSVTVDNYGYIDGEEGEYVVISLREFPDKFYFGGGVVTDKFEELDKALSKDEKAQILEEGLPVLFQNRQNKAKKREYMTCVFYPEF